MDTHKQSPTLAERASPVDIPPEEFRQLAHRLVDQIADQLAAVPTRRVKPDESHDAVRQAIGGHASLPEEATAPGTLLAETTESLFEHSLFNSHPRFFGYITSGPAPIGVLGDFLASAVNPNVGAYKLAPLATEIEAQTVRWLAELIGYPTNCGGLLVSGGNMANFVGFLAARRAKADRKPAGRVASPRFSIGSHHAGRPGWVRLPAGTPRRSKGAQVRT